MEVRIYNLHVDPLALVRAFDGTAGIFLLESSMRQAERGRYSFFGCDPFVTISGDDLNAFENLKKNYKRFEKKTVIGHTPFSSGLVGYLSYDFGLQFENIKSRRKDHHGLPGFLFGFYDCVITIDHYKRKVIVSSTGLPETKSLLRKKRAQSRLASIEKVLSTLESTVNFKSPKTRANFRLRSNFTKAGFCGAAQKVLDHICTGDIYQANLAQEFSSQFVQPVDATRLYHVLRKLSPSCFSGYLDIGRSQIVSSSPELFLRLRKGIAQTRPMKGTRPRGQTIIRDRKLNTQLLRNVKEKAELLMVTDLERNDLGRVCDYGSVRVQKIREIEKYRTVYQATATVTGKLAKNKNGFDLISACFPSGSVTGCPKIRAMEIIDKLENSRRGIYTGALGYMSFNGDMEFNVLIRTMLVTGNNVQFHVGSGIVADSRPQREYEETLVKARALKESLRMI
ncbi:MAG: anthranilate synthase component I family protein [Candidatus Omnitrophica bacterium]|nr:anthranilate synthase component I family protein [Candidatus Omnitrophota bacterium]